MVCMAALRVLVMVLTTVALLAPAFAQEEELAEEEAPRAEKGKKRRPETGSIRDAQAPHKEGEYGGVVPGKAPEGAPTHKKKPKGPTLTWVGFQTFEGGSSRVFVQLNVQASYTQNVVGDELVVTVAGVKLGNFNHGRPLDTSFFAAAVARVKAQRVKGRGAAGVELRIKFKGGAPQQADAHLEPAQDGYQYLYLDFGPGAGGGSVKDAG